MSQHRPLRIVKVGGSLLDLDDLATRLQRWLAEEPGSANVLVVGGGHGVELIRARRQELTEIEAHWLAIDAMLTNARMIRTVLSEAQWFERIHEVRHPVVPLGIMNPATFLRYDDAAHAAGPLPSTWEVTSDSIAARAADLSAADELVLLKSALPPEHATLDRLAAVGYVDAFFPQASRGLSCVRCVNLRGKESRAVLGQAGTARRGSVAFLRQRSP